MPGLRHEVHELTRHYDHFAYRCGTDEFLDVRIGERGGAQRSLIGVGGKRQMRAQPAVHLDDYVHGGGLQRLMVDFDPPRVDECALMPQNPPQRMCDMRDYGSKSEDRDFEALVNDAAILRRELFEFG